MDRRVYSEVMERANGECEMCGKGGALQLHHIFQGHGRRRKTEILECCAALCVDCHISVHANRKYDLELKRLAQEKLREKGLTDDEIRDRVGGKLY